MRARDPDREGYVDHHGVKLGVERQGAAALAVATGGRLAVLEGGGHIPQARDPVKVNLLLREFVESLRGRAA